MERESFRSRLGFILISAGCAIGIGNVWRFPYVVGNSGGGFFVLLYLFFLVIMGVPILTMEYAVGRASRKSAAYAFNTLEKKGQKWHVMRYVALVGCYILMMFYTVVAGWMLYYFYLMASGAFTGLDAQGVETVFAGMLAKPGVMAAYTIGIIVVGFAVCSLGLKKGLERFSKWMMLALLGIMIVLAVRSIFLSGGEEGLAFYLLPSMEKMREAGLGQVVTAAMTQSFFTLSIGISAMEIFGSYLTRERTLLGETFMVCGLDTLVAVVSGLIIFPACFAFGVSADSGPRLIFITLPNVFNAMPGGRVWGALFFVFMTFAAFSTVIAVFENLIALTTELTGISRKKATVINGALLILLSMPCVLGFNVLSGFEPLRAGNSVMDLEDFLVSNVLLPVGSLAYVLFCTSRRGWGWKKFQAEANHGKGPKLPNGLRIYCTYILPVLVAVILVYGLVTYFKKTWGRCLVQRPFSALERKTVPFFAVLM